MRVTCPSCQEQFPLSAGLLDAEAKRFGIALAAVDPVVGRALVPYLALHKPVKTALRLAKAARIVEEIGALVAAGTVRRNGVSRRATPAVWAQAMEQMVDARANLRLPLSGHGYLLEIVSSLADQADAAGERAKEADLRAGKRRAGPSDNVPRETPLQAHIAWLRQQLELGAITPEEHATQVEAARIKFGRAG
jgi:hypothetical protein